MIGIITAYVNEILLFKEKNTIHADLLGYMKDILYSNITTKFIDNTTLFDVQDVDAGANSINKDGIIISTLGDSTGIHKTAIPTVAVIVAGAIRSWKGTFDADMFPVAVDSAGMGSDLVSAGVFTFTFATYNFPLIVVPPQGRFVLSWEISMAANA